MPQIRFEQLEQHLSRQLSPLYVIHGDEPLLSLEAADSIRAKARAAGCAEREVLLAERGFDWSRLAYASSGLSLFAERKLVELRIPTGKPGDAGAAAIVEYCANLVEENVTIVSVPRLFKAEQMSRWFTALSNRGMVITVYPVERSRLPMWIAARLARQKQEAEDAALGFMADSVEGNLLAAHQEIQKLGLLFPPGRLNLDQVRAAVLNVSRHDVLHAAEAMLAGDAARAVKVLESLEGEGEQPLRLLYVLTEELRALARIRAGMTARANVQDLLRSNRIWGEPRTTLMTRAARSVDPEAVEAALLHAGRIDRLAKGIGMGDVWDELLALTLRFCHQIDEARLRGDAAPA